MFWGKRLSFCRVKGTVLLTRRCEQSRPLNSWFFGTTSLSTSKIRTNVRRDRSEFSLIFSVKKPVPLTRTLFCPCRMGCTLIVNGARGVIVIKFTVKEVHFTPKPCVRCKRFILDGLLCYHIVTFDIYAFRL